MNTRINVVFGLIKTLCITGVEKSTKNGQKRVDKQVTKEKLDFVRDRVVSLNYKIIGKQISKLFISTFG